VLDFISVQEFLIVWSVSGSCDFQLITWSKDRTLRFWPIEPDVMQVRVSIYLSILH
jgi:hypothetical protein